jgi:acetolactate synthase regulatory subunit
MSTQIKTANASQGKSKKRILSVTIQRVFDEDPDTSYLGEYSSKRKSDYTIERRHEQDCNLNSNTTPSRLMLERVLSRAEAQHTIICENHTTSVNDECWACDVEAKSQAALELIREQIDALEECNCGGVHIERNSFELFNPNHDNYQGLPDAEIRKYCWQDYERMESLSNGSWSFLGIVAECEVEVIVDGKPYTTELHASLWGIESDSDREYLKTTEGEQIADIRSQLKEYGFSTRAISQAMKSIERKEA